MWVAHESELPGPGTFKSTYVGRQPVIVSRDRKGALHTLLNRCRHGGASLCEKPRGKANGFTGRTTRGPTAWMAHCAVARTRTGTRAWRTRRTFVAAQAAHRVLTAALRPCANWSAPCTAPGSTSTCSRTCRCRRRSSASCGRSRSTRR
ncbi:Rieske 2Fe-2S domain-containing protein [Amycolatopsis methanolica]|uniref:Rieske 2Fe-2S domain-containing protein n=1 Tax=Amycolatopsis methanolica TaxID=1814 RepID=UPI001CC24A5B|nr:Rieske 2Fe-2S domain-containing protein [Amycolatopsis methanolica]